MPRKNAYLALVVNNQAESVTHEGRDMQSGFCGTDDRNVHGGFPCAESIASSASSFLPARLKLFSKIGRHTEFRRRQSVEVWTGRHHDRLEFLGE